MAWEEPPHRHTLTPIGDELEVRNEPLMVGQPSLIDRFRRHLSVLEGLIPTPRTRSEQVIYGLVSFAIVLAATLGAAFAVGLFVEDHTTLTHNRALLTVFLISGVGLGVPPLVILPFSIPARMFAFRRRPAGPSDEEEASDDLPEYGVWQAHWAFWIILGLCLIVTGFAVWGRGTS